MKISSETPILVTGGASGLGLAVVEKFAGMGAKVAIFDMNVEEGNRVAALHGASFQKVVERSMGVVDVEELDERM